jgi:crotonobetainyl-CoA:carnitine CoA-transferase CaiB-like acyl-CoA transferase
MKTPERCRALEGIVIVDMTQFQQGPVATTMLAEMGAEVIKVEPRLTGDPGRYHHPVAKVGLSSYFEANNRGKKSITLDIRKDKGKEILYKLVEKADVFVENFRVGVAERRGFGYDDLRRINPGIIYDKISGWGLKGPSAKLPGYDGVGQSIGGVASIVGEEKDRLSTLKVSIGDQTGGFLAAYGIMVALFHRERTGEGQKIDSSLIGGQIALMGFQMQYHLLSDEVLPRTRSRMSRSGTPTLASTFEAKDGKSFHIQIIGKDFDRCFKALGMENFLTDPRFDTQEKRFRDQDGFHAPLDELFLTKNRDEWLRILRENDIVCAPVNNFAEAANDPDVIANEYITEVDHPKAGRIRVLGIPVKFSKTPGHIGTAPELGQHTEEILKRFGYSLAEIAELKREEVI